MRRVSSVLVAVLLSTALVVPALAASPSGRGTTTIRYQSAEYYDFVLGATVVCTGIHQFGPRWSGDATSGGRDVYRCRSLSGPFTNVQHDDKFLYPVGAWSSDYFFDFQGGIVVRNTRPVRLHIAGNNLSYHAIAYFAEP
jgi:hypothetical protein